MTHEREGMASGEVSEAHRRAFGGKWQGVIRTVSGVYIDLENLATAHWKIEDIAHGLAMVCRYGGHVNAHYSVAEHSMSVARQVRRHLSTDNPMSENRMLELAALLHDAEEAYIGDMVRPLKHLPSMGEFRDIGQAIINSIYDKFRIPDAYRDHPLIKQIDGEILQWEMTMVRDSTVRVAPNPEDVKQKFLEYVYLVRPT